MDPQRLERIDQWEEFMKTHPDWKKIHSQFINAQFDMAERFWNRMLAEPEGKERLRELYNIKNKRAVPQFF